MTTHAHRVEAGGVVRRYVRVLGILLVLQALGGAVFKLLQERADDLPHAGLHLVSGVWALAASSQPPASSAARLFAPGFAALYLSLGVFGHLQAAAVAALNLEFADHAFHIAVGGTTLAVALQPSRTATGTQVTSGASR